MWDLRLFELVRRRCVALGGVVADAAPLRTDNGPARARVARRARIETRASAEPSVNTPTRCAEGAERAYLCLDEGICGGSSSTSSFVYDGL